MFRKNLEKITSFFEKKLFKIGIDYSEVLFKEEPHLDKDFLKIAKRRESKIRWEYRQERLIN